MASDPEPRDLFTFQETNCAIAARDSNGVDRTMAVDFLEVEPLVTRVTGKEEIRLFASSRMSRGKSWQAVQKRGVARDFTIRWDRVL